MGQSSVSAPFSCILHLMKQTSAKSCVNLKETIDFFGNACYTFGKFRETQPLNYKGGLL